MLYVAVTRAKKNLVISKDVFHLLMVSHCHLETLVGKITEQSCHTCGCKFQPMALTLQRNGKQRVQILVLACDMLYMCNDFRNEPPVRRRPDHLSVVRGRLLRVSGGSGLRLPALVPG